jgi:zinc protease
LSPWGGVGGLTPVDLGRCWPDAASASPDIDSHTHGVSGSSTPKDLETALQLVYLTFTAPGLTDEGFGLLQRRFGAMLENQRQSPRYLFGEKVRELTTSGHYSSKSLTAADVQGLDVQVMRRDYAARFGNAADFTFFMVGAFDEPRWCRWWSSGWRRCPRPVRATRVPRYGDDVPEGIERAQVTKGKEPASQNAIAFFADPA